LSTSIDTLFNMKKIKHADSIVANVIKDRDYRDKGYRARSLKIHPWVCARCGRDFNNGNIHELTVHHKDNNHANNPPDGHNWEHLCLYCHDDEHARSVSTINTEPCSASLKQVQKYKPFEGLLKLIKNET